MSTSVRLVRMLQRLVRKFYVSLKKVLDTIWKRKRNWLGHMLRHSGKLRDNRTKDARGKGYEKKTDTELDVE